MTHWLAGLVFAFHGDRTTPGGYAVIIALAILLVTAIVYLLRH